MHNYLEADSVVKYFGNRRVLSDIYLKCYTGDIIGLLGRNGCGKSTLLKIIFGTMPTENKFVRIDGVKYDHPFKTRDLIGYLPQHNFLLNPLTVLKTAALYLKPEQIDGFLDDPVIGRVKHNKISTLSGGELRYLEIKLILNGPYKFVLLDEPFNGVAPVVVEQLKPMMTHHAKTKGIMLTDHDHRNVLDVANRCCLIYDGCIKTIENKDDLVRWGYLSG